MVDLAVKKGEKPVIEKDRIVAVGGSDSLMVARGRKQGLAAYAEMEIPTRTNHLWKWARAVDFMPSTNIAQAPRVGSADVDDQGDWRDGTGQITVHLPPSAWQAQVVVESLAGATDVTVGQVVTAQHGIIEAMNLSLWSTGVHIRVPAGAVIDEPLSVTVNGQEYTPFVRLYLSVGDGAQAVLTERWVGGGDFAASGVCEVSVGSGARLEHGIVDERDAGHRLAYTKRAFVDRDGNYRLVAVQLGHGRLKADLGGLVAGPGANSTILSFSLCDRQNTVDLNTVHHHLAPHGISDIRCRSVVADKARFGNTGKIRVEKDAIYTEANQITRNLLLSKTATACAIPELEILNNEVACAHGAATGQLDPDHLFYLATRGLDRAQATRLLVDGQLAEILEGSNQLLVASILERAAVRFDQLFGEAV